MKIPRLLRLGLAFLATAVLALAQYPIPNGARVLFVGNSLTGQANGGLPAYVNAAFSQGNAGIEMKWHRIQIWNQTLKTHWNNNGADTKACTAAGVGIYANKTVTQMHARMLIEGGHPDGNPWDYVVLQGYGEDAQLNSIAANGTLSGDFFIFANNFVALARSKGAIPLLYQRVPNNPAEVAQSAYDTQYANIVANNATLAAHLDLLVVPVAEVNHALTINPPSGQSTGWLYSDNIHPSDYGLAVQMYVFASMLAKKSYQNTPVTYGKYTSPAAALDTAIRNAVWNKVQNFVTGSTPSNQAPVADAGSDQTVTDTDGNGTQSVTLDGSGSADPGGSIASYAWSWANGGSATGVSPTVTLPVGTTVITLTVTDNGSPALTDTDTVSITVNPAGASTGGFAQSNGLLVMEAENATAIEAGSGASADPAWVVVSATDASGSSAVSTPNTPAAWTTHTTTASSALKFDAAFTSTGNHHLWVRARATVANGGDDSVNYRLDDGPLATLVTANSTSWTWTKASAAINVSTTGLHTLRIHVRENGVQIDKILLTTDSAYAPSGAGPAETRAPATPVAFEAELLDFTTSDTVTTYNESPASGGSYDFLNSNAVGDYVAYTVEVPVAATYAIGLRYKGHASRGICQLTIGTTPQGSAFDQRVSGFQTVNLGSRQLSAGPHTFRFEVTGTSGTGYSLSFDSITLTP
jgi:hypothetical protein